MEEARNTTWQRELGKKLKNSIVELEHVDWIAMHMGDYQFHGEIAEEVREKFIKYAKSPDVYYSACKETTHNFYRLYDNNVYDSVLGITDYDNCIKGSRLEDFFIPVDIGDQEQDWILVPIGYVKEKLGGTDMDYVRPLVDSSKLVTGNWIQCLRLKVDESLKSMDYMKRLLSNKNIHLDETAPVKKTMLQQYHGRIVIEVLLHLLWFWLWCEAMTKFAFGGGIVRWIITIGFLGWIGFEAFSLFSTVFSYECFANVKGRYVRMEKAKKKLGDLAGSIANDAMFREDGTLVAKQSNYEFVRGVLEDAKIREQLPPKGTTILAMLDIVSESSIFRLVLGIIICGVCIAIFR